MKRFAIIPAGGVGKRIGSDVPKQFMLINSKEIIAYTISVFDDCKLIDEIVVAVAKEYFPLMEEIIGKYSFSKKIIIAEGGKSRQDSVFSAISSVNIADDDLICVHDAARPFLSKATLEKALLRAEKLGNAVVAVKARDTLSFADSKATVVSYLEREKVYYIQTPQIFKFAIFKIAMEKAIRENLQGTDESTLVYNSGVNINLVDGEMKNFKITTKEDLKFASEILS